MKSNIVKIQTDLDPAKILQHVTSVLLLQSFKYMLFPTQSNAKSLLLLSISFEQLQNSDKVPLLKTITSVTMHCMIEQVVSQPH